MSDLLNLTRPFKPNLISKAAQGKFGDYVGHDVVTQKLLADIGPFDIAVGEVFTGGDGKIEGCLVTCTYRIDERFITITEVGDCEQPSNWKTQGARMKDAVSDGIKRCAMRIGVGLHLRDEQNYFLHDYLKKKEDPAYVSPNTPGYVYGPVTDSGQIIEPNTSNETSLAAVARAVRNTTPGYDQPLTPRVKPDA